MAALVFIANDPDEATATRHAGRPPSRRGRHPAPAPPPPRADPDGQAEAQAGQARQDLRRRSSTTPAPRAWPAASPRRPRRPAGTSWHRQLVRHGRQHHGLLPAAAQGRRPGARLRPRHQEDQARAGPDAVRPHHGDPHRRLLRLGRLVLRSPGHRSDPLRQRSRRAGTVVPWSSARHGRAGVRRRGARRRRPGRRARLRRHPGPDRRGPGEAPTSTPTRPTCSWTWRRRSARSPSSPAARPARCWPSAGWTRSATRSASTAASCSCSASTATSAGPRPTAG